MDTDAKFQLAISAAIIAFLLLFKGADSAPRCPNGGAWTPQGCVYQRPGMVCAWPWKLVKVGSVTVCMKWAVTP